MHREVKMKRVYIAMIILAIVLYIGTSGALDHDTVTIRDALIQYGAALVLGVVGVFGCRLENRRGK